MKTFVFLMIVSMISFSSQSFGGKSQEEPLKSEEDDLNSSPMKSTSSKPRNKDSEKENCSPNKSPPENKVDKRKRKKVHFEVQEEKETTCPNKDPSLDDSPPKKITRLSEKHRTKKAYNGRDSTLRDYSKKKTTSKTLLEPAENQPKD